MQVWLFHPGERFVKCNEAAARRRSEFVDLIFLSFKVLAMSCSRPSPSSLPSASIAACVLVLGMRNNLGGQGDGVTAAELQRIQREGRKLEKASCVSLPETGRKLAPSLPKPNVRNCETGVPERRAKSASTKTPRPSRMPFAATV